MQKNQGLLKQFGEIVKTHREVRGFTQQELAVRAGMTEKHVGEIERGVTEPSITAIAALAAGLQVTMTELMPDKERQVSAPPQISYAKWQTVYESTLELNDAAREALDFGDALRGETPPARRRPQPRQFKKRTPPPRRKKGRRRD